MMHDGFGALSFSSGVVNRMDQERIKSEVHLLISFLCVIMAFAWYRSAFSLLLRDRWKPYHDPAKGRFCHIIFFSRSQLR